MVINDTALRRPRFGWRRILVLVRREGHNVGEYRLRRIYREEGLALRQKSPKRRRSAVVRQPRALAVQPNDIWSMDFMHDRLSDGRKIRLLTIVDTFSRECVALEVSYGFRSHDVIAILRRVTAKRGKPTTVRCDNGSEFTSTEFDQWAYWNQIAIDFSRPGKPTDNAFIESFNGRVRQELLNPSWFDTLEQAQREAASWRRDYNEIRRSDRWATNRRKSSSWLANVTYRMSKITGRAGAKNHPRSKGPDLTISTCAVLPPQVTSNGATG